MLAVVSITFFFAADVKCGLYEINKNNRETATHGPSPIQKMFRDRTEAMLDEEVQDQNLVLTLIITSLALSLCVPPAYQFVCIIISNHNILAVTAVHECQEFDKCFDGWLVECGLTSHSTHYRSFRRRWG